MRTRSPFLNSILLPRRMRHTVADFCVFCVVKSVDVTGKIAGHAPYAFKANAFSCCFLHNEIFLSLICCKYNCTVTRILALAKKQARIRKVEAVERDHSEDGDSHVSRGIAATARLRCEAKDFSSESEGLGREILSSEHGSRGKCHFDNSAVGRTPQDNYFLFRRRDLNPRHAANRLFYRLNYDGTRE